MNEPLRQQESYSMMNKLRKNEGDIKSCVVNEWKSRKPLKLSLVSKWMKWGLWVIDVIEEVKSIKASPYATC